MTRYNVRTLFALLVSVLGLVGTARAEQPPLAQSGYRQPLQKPFHYHYTPYRAASYASPTTDAGREPYCARHHACGAGLMCSRGRCVPYRTEGYGGWVALGHALLGPVGSSVAHFSHDQIGKGFLSLGAGTGSFLMGGMLICGGAEPDRCSYDRFIAGAVLGYVVFAVLDSTLIARRKVPVQLFTASPTIIPSRHGLTGGVQASF